MPSFHRSKKASWWLATLSALVLALGACGADDPPVRDPRDEGPPKPPVRADGGAGGGEGGSGGSIGDGGSGGSIVAPSLRVDQVRPPRGRLSGGDSVIINGAGFVTTAPTGPRPTDSTEVFFGSNPAIDARVIDDDTILATTPPGVEGDVDVTVRNPNAESVCVGCYRFQAEVDLRRIEPNRGPIHGGVAITLEGENLRDSMVVLVGNRAALDVQRQSDGSLLAILPPADEEGSVDVRVYDADGQDVLRKAFTYVAPLRIEELDPPGGPLDGGNEVIVRGRGLSSNAEVFVDGLRAQVSWQQDGSLRVLVPAGDEAGAVPFEVRTDAGSATVPYGYWDPSDPEVRVHVVFPPTGPISGGDEVIVVGSHLDREGLALRFGEAFAEDARAISPNLVVATLPPAAAAGQVDVHLRVAGGQDTLEDGFRYVDAIRVDAVTPGSGPVDGGTQIAITGRGFPQGAKVYVGALPATGVEWLGADRLRAITPRGTDGPVPVRVVHPDDPENEGTLRAGFFYDGPFSVDRIDPTTGSQAGGTRVIARGRGFRSGMNVTFHETWATVVDVLDGYTALIQSPRGERGTVDVIFDTPTGDQVTLNAAYTYFDPTNSTGGSSGGPLNGSLNVTVLDDGRARRGIPLPGVLVVVGTDDSTPLQGRTDERGQITFSDPSLVKAQTVTAALARYQTTTVVNQASEHLTILLEPNSEPSECQDGIDNDGDGLIDFDDIDGCQCSPANYDALDNPPPASACMCPQMPQEASVCCDGIDNDGDGLIDGDDPDCVCTGGASEGPLAECSDCKDNDGDGRVDYGGLNPDPGCASPSDTEDGIIVAGKVWGFKLPGGRTLGPDEVEEAHVRISVDFLHMAPPFGGLRSPIRITRDGGSYAYEFASSRYMAIYAIYGVRDTITNEFEPLLMGVRRGVAPTPGNDITNADIVLDTHLDTTVPVTIDNPPSVAGDPGATIAYAYVDLGREGVIPMGQAVVDETGVALVEKLPDLSGENFVFLARGNPEGSTLPYTVTWRRQPGDVTQGVTIGPLMGLAHVVQPAASFEGVIEWAGEPGPAPDLIEVAIYEPTLAGPILQWQMVVPGTETRVVVPPQVLATLKSRYPPGMQLTGQLIRAREPRFDFGQWTYDNLNMGLFTSFTVSVHPIQL